ncbi:MAG: hypothetical protein ACD_73C00195G0003 [uncultured bacterium]|nr:MAG: hypothetical protein ACD_73C00195G0003 [uncultured bacterium]
MTMMCSMKGCSEKAGMCKHEKMMGGMMFIGIMAALGHFVFNWF